MQASVDLARDVQAPAITPPPSDRGRASEDSAVGWVVPYLLLFGALVFFLSFLLNGATGDLQSAVALAITSIPFLIAAVDAPGRLLHPLSIFGFTMLLGIAGQTVYLTHAHPAVLPNLLSGLPIDILNRGLLVVSLGIIALSIGYIAAGAGNRRATPGRLLLGAVWNGLAMSSPRRAFWVSAALCVISIIAFAVYAPKVGIHSPSDLLSSRKRFVRQDGKVLVYGYYRFVMFLVGSGFVMVVYVMIRNGVSLRSRLGAVGFISLLLTAGYAVVTSSRTELFATVGVAVFTMIALRHREPRAVAVVSVAVLAIASLTLLGGLRSVEDGEARSLSSTTGTEALIENAVGNGSWMDIGPISVLLHRVPEAYPYQYGKTLVAILWAPIPRSMWPGKPPVRIGPVIGPRVFGLSEQRITGDPVGFLGELWLNGGVYLVVFGMLLVGAVIKWVDRFYRLVDQTDGLSAILYGILVVGTCLQLPIDDITGVLIPLIENTLTIIVLLWLVRDRGHISGRHRVPASNQLTRT